MCKAEKVQHPSPSLTQPEYKKPVGYWLNLPKFPADSANILKQGSPRKLNFLRLYGGIERRTLRSSQILSYNIKDDQTDREIILIDSRSTRSTCREPCAIFSMPPSSTAAEKEIT